MSTFNISGGNFGAAGDKSKAENFTQTDQRQANLSEAELSALKAELPMLLERLRSGAASPDQATAITEVEAAQEALNRNDTGTALSRLKAAGGWVITIAEHIGTGIIAKLIETKLMGG